MIAVAMGMAAGEVVAVAAPILSRPKNVLNKIYCFEKCLLELDPIDLYAYQ
jgi:hypothetical protein